MQHRPSVVVLDVNETLSDTNPLADVFLDVGAPAALAKTWFASVLRDGFALAAAGGSAPFADLAKDVLRAALSEADVPDVDGGVDRVMAAFTSLDVHPDVPAGLHGLKDAGLRIVSLTNGSTDVSHSLLERAGVRDVFEHVLSVEDAGVWKPARGAYQHAATVCGVDRADMLLVAVHPWDVDGAGRAGLATAWVDRKGLPYPSSLRPAHVVVGALTDLPGRLPPAA